MMRFKKTMNTFFPADAASGPHKGQPVLTIGEPLDKAQAALVMLHGRGASAQDILTLVPELIQPGFAFLAPQAAQYTWYPQSFLVEIQRNEPWLSSALSVIDATLAHIREAGIPAERTMLLGFSQGACLTLEYVARHAQRYGGVAGLTGGLIGPDGTSRDYPGSLAGTPIFLGCSDVDFHIPKERFLLSAEVLQGIGAAVTARLYPGMGHTVNQDEIEEVRKIQSTMIQ
jgi:predicted esterase